ncbi:MAG: hypothetical protein J6M34_08410 [Clostridia bacterium]|nr:hypothetical protein [Clostridia bacterium]
MTNTKRALILSVFALVLCVSMLVGSTYAWFTDTATTGVSTIQAGTLKVDLVDANDATLVGQSLAFQKAAGAENEPVLWEPGCKYELAPVYVKNNGNLALKYQIIVNGLDGDAELLNVIDFKVMMNNAEVDLDTFEGKLAADAKSAAITLVGEMSKDAGNEYQGKTLSGLSITVVATQDTVESDSYGNQYDAGATYPTPVSNAAELAAVLANGGTASLTGDITVDEPIEVSKSATIDFNGSELNTSVSMNRPLKITGDDVKLVINADGTTNTFGNDTYGVVEIVEGVQNATVEINGGKFEGTTKQGAFVKIRNNVTGKIVLNDVTFIDNCSVTAGNTNAFVMNTNGSTSGDVEVEINGGYMESAGGFYIGGTVKKATLNGVTIKTEGAAFEAYCADGTYINDCNITVVPGTTIWTAPAAGVAVSNNGQAFVTNTTIDSAGYGLYVYPTQNADQGVIVANGCTITSVLGNVAGNGTITIQ